MVHVCKSFSATAETAMSGKKERKNEKKQDSCVDI